MLSEPRRTRCRIYLLLEFSSLDPWHDSRDLTPLEFSGFKKGRAKAVKIHLPTHLSTTNMGEFDTSVGGFWHSGLVTYCSDLTVDDLGVLLIGLFSAFIRTWFAPQPTHTWFFFSTVNTYLYGLVTYQFLVYANTSMLFLWPPWPLSNWMHRIQWPPLDQASHFRVASSFMATYPHSRVIVGTLFATDTLHSAVWVLDFSKVSGVY